MDADQIAALRRISNARRAISEIRMKHKRRLDARDDKMLLDMFERSIAVEPDGAGLPCIIAVAHELTAQYW